MRRSSTRTSRRRTPAAARSSSSFPASVWDDPSVLAGAQSGLAALPEFSGLVGPLNPNGIPLTTDQLVQLHATLGPGGPAPARADDDRRAGPDVRRPTGRRPSSSARTGSTIQFSVVFANGDTTSPAALDAVPAMRSDVDRVARSVGAQASGVYGQVAFAADIAHISGSDLERIVPIVAVLIALLLAIVLRSARRAALPRR